MRPDGTDAHKVFEGDANSGFLGAEWSPDSQRLSFEWGQRIGGKIDWNMVSRDLKGRTCCHRDSGRYRGLELVSRRANDLFVG